MPTQANPLARLFIDPHSQLPPAAQLKDQIKFACVNRDIVQGDVLPSIRALARQLGVGEGVVRRAYRELCDTGLLAAEQRRHVVVTPVLETPSQTDRVKAGVDQCDRLIAWARENQLSAISLGRLLLRRATVQEVESPPYLFVDVCIRAAEMSVNRIAKTWGIKAQAVSMGDFAAVWNHQPRLATTVLVNVHLHKEVRDVVGETTPVFTVSMRPDERLRQKMSRLPPNSAVVLVSSGQGSPVPARAMLSQCEQLLRKKLRPQVKSVTDIPNLHKFVGARRFRLFLFSPLVWETLPARIRRMPGVAPATCEPDPQSLEEIRIAAGVLL